MKTPFVINPMVNLYIHTIHPNQWEAATGEKISQPESMYTTINTQWEPFALTNRTTWEDGNLLEPPSEYYYSQAAILLRESLKPSEIKGFLDFHYLKGGDPVGLIDFLENGLLDYSPFPEHRMAIIMEWVRTTQTRNPQPPPTPPPPTSNHLKDHVRNWSKVESFLLKWNHKGEKLIQRDGDGFKYTGDVGLMCSLFYQLREADMFKGTKPPTVAKRVQIITETFGFKVTESQMNEWFSSDYDGKRTPIKLP